jgi:hypothetical protein
MQEKAILKPDQLNRASGTITTAEKYLRGREHNN